MKKSSRPFPFSARLCLADLGCLQRGPFLPGALFKIPLSQWSVKNSQRCWKTSDVWDSSQGIVIYSEDSQREGQEERSPGLQEEESRKGDLEICSGSMAAHWVYIWLQQTLWSFLQEGYEKVSDEWVDHPVGKILMPTTHMVWIFSWKWLSQSLLSHSSLLLFQSTDGSFLCGPVCCLSFP